MSFKSNITPIAGSRTTSVHVQKVTLTLFNRTTGEILPDIDFDGIEDAKKYAARVISGGGSWSMTFAITEQTTIN